MLNTTENPSNETTTKEEENMDTQSATVIDPGTVTVIQANLHVVKEQADELTAQIAELEGRLQRARGTGDVTPQAKVAAPQQTVVRRLGRPPRAPKQPRELIESALKGVSMNIPHLAKTTGLSNNKVTEAIRSLRSDQKVVNVGSEDFPQWTYRIGDRASTSELNAEVKRLITERPMTTQELMHFTGARLSRVSGALINLQRTEVQLLNRGTARRAKWFLVDDRAVISRLPPKN